MRYQFWYISSPHTRPNKNVKWPNPSFCGEREHTTVNFSFSLSTSTSFSPVLLLDSWDTLYKLNELE